MEELPEPRPLITEKHSLEPDMLFGWRPRQLKKKCPIPIFYLRSFALKNQTDREVFHGPRPVDSFIMHQQFEGHSEYGFNFNDPLISAWRYLSKKNLAKYPDRRRFQGMAPRLPPNCLSFDANCEGSNLDKVVMLDENSYELYLRSDTNSLSPQLWFYFSISNIQYSRVVELTILNLVDSARVYEIGMRPVMFSELNNKIKPNLGWERVGSEIRYSKSRLSAGSMAKRSYFQLTFEVDLTTTDRVFLAPTFPYSCSNLHRFLGTLSPGVYRRSKLCETLGGVPIPLITITDPTVPKSQKKYVVLSSRLRPVDTYTSFICEGLIAYLISEDPSAKQARRQLVFKILPIGNPDGVVAGNTRSTLAGRDLNFGFARPQAHLQPFAHSLKAKLKKYSFTNKLLLFINLESNYKKKGSFMFGPYYPIHDRRYYLSRMVPKLLSDKTSMFRYFSCRFMPDQETSNEMYRVMQAESGALCYSMQTSVYAFLDEQRETTEYSQDDLRHLGQCLGMSIGEYMNILIENEQREKQRAKERMIRQHSAHVAKHAPEKDQGLTSLIDLIKQTEANHEVDSDIEQWSNEEDEFDAQSTAEIVNALHNFNSYIEENKRSKESFPCSQQRSHGRRQNRKLTKNGSHGVKPTEGFVPKCPPVRINRCVFGPESVVHQSQLPNLKPTLKQRKATSCMKLKPKAAPEDLLSTTTVQSYYSFPKPKKKSYSTVVSKCHLMAPSKYSKFGPFPSIALHNELVYLGAPSHTLGSKT